MEPRLSLVTLGVADLVRSRRFYESLGWKASAIGDGHVVFFQLGGMILSLYGHEDLAKDAQLPPDPAPKFRGITLACNVRTKEQVAVVLNEAKEAGGRILKPAQDVFWGGHSGYFADPDGHAWEIAWNPHFPIHDNGTVHLPG